MNDVKLAFRNVLRNGRRTLLNLIMIAGGFCSIVLFQGFVSYLLGNLREGAVNNQYGHFQIARTNFWNPTASETTKERMIQKPSEILEKVKAMPEVEYGSGRVKFYGLLSTGEQTISAMFVGFDPAVETRMRDALNIIKGENFPLGGSDKNIALAGKGIIKELGGNVGQDLTILAQTLDGTVNAMDVTLSGIFQTTISEIDDTTIYLPLHSAQKLLDTDSVERLIFVVKDENKLSKVVAKSASLLPQEFKPREWLELATLFRQVQDYFRVQNRMFEMIIIVLVLLSISNTVGMSIFERTGEIGTLRAIGDTTGDIIRKFTIEGVILGVIGSILGALLTLLIANIINSIEILITIPGASIPLPVRINFLPFAYFYASLLAIFTSAIATYFPALRISKLGIVEALRHNI